MIVVPTPEIDSPAARALRMEGLEYQEERCANDYAYGHLFSELWDEGKPFVIVEWDVIPWPGAIEAMLLCPRPWCSYPYPLHAGNVTSSFGIGKYVPEGSKAPESWRCEWWLLDGAVIPDLRQRLGAVCLHGPPVAHARRLSDA